MINQHSLFFFDISSAILMIILAYLSKRLGDALKIKPYYKVLFATGFLVVCASGLDILSQTIPIHSISVISVSLRFVAGAAAFFICLRYWNWLLSEFFKN